MPVTRPKKKATKPPRRPNIRWDTHKRQVLCCLYRFFRREPKVWEEVFSHIFMSHLIERGIAGFVPFQTLNIQWTHMRDHGDTDWHHVHIATEFNKGGEWKDIIARIKSAARSLRLQIREKDEDSVDTSRWKPPGLLALRTEQAPPLAAPMSSPAIIVPAPFTNQVKAFTFHETEEQEQGSRLTQVENDNEPIEISSDDESEEDSQSASDHPVVNSHEKVCIWCEQGGPLINEPGEGLGFSQAHSRDQQIRNSNQSAHSDYYSDHQDQYREYENQIEISDDGQSQEWDYRHHFIQHQIREQESAILDSEIENSVTSTQNALQSEWIFEDDVPDTPTPCQRKDPRVHEREQNIHGDHIDLAEDRQIQLFFPDGSWKNGHVDM
ncbi:hypothetical protein MYU51_008251 [Penicillium brevicompactum]|uniref:uncharacterized protein n=1 Tax=Penicillium brevicompactum TaxID=5074 RepID=UPI00254154B3|nr:uncharacterized protein N7506_010139 [Penicillium brevicompactum]KAJ5327037.1 hypothetical protein N7506_010139 [Penicillium brevicompactum]